MPSPQAGLRHYRPIRVHALIDGLGSGGAEFLLADFAAVAPSAGIELTVAALEPITSASPAADRLHDQGVDPLGLPVRSTVNPRELHRLRQHLAQVGPDLVHTHLSTADFLGGVAARSLRIPSVSTIHADTWPEERGDRVRAWLALRARRNCAALVIAVSNSARTAYLSSARDKARHVVVVRNGIADRAAPGRGEALRRDLGLDADALVVTMLSKLRAEKNFEAAIEAVAALSGRFPQLRLVIAGDGPHEQTIRARAQDLGDRVLLVGHREDSMELLDATDVLVHPSHFDALPTAAIEAMAAGVPVVASDVGGIPEIVKDDATGFLISPPPTGEAVARSLAPLLEQPRLRQRFASAARAEYEREYGAESWAHRLRAVYDQVLGINTG